MATLPTTFEEWIEMPEVQDGKEEVVSGEIRITPPPKWKHSELIDNLADVLKSRFDKRTVSVKVAQFGLVIREHPLTSRVPDLAVFRNQTIIEQDGYVHSAPQLIVRVLSPNNTRREREDKLADCAAIGVPELWVVSPEALTVEVLYLEDARLRRSQILAEGTLKPKQFPDVEIDIAAIWPD